jgi:hypothetical protein
VKIAKYSLLTLHPSSERIDCLCVGAAVLADSAWHIVTLTTPEKIYAVDAGYPISRLTTTAANLSRLLSDCITLSDARAWLSSNRSTIALHDFEGVFTYDTDAQLKDQIQAIMLESVIPIAVSKDMAVRIQKIKPRIKAHLTKQFKNWGVYSKDKGDIDQHKVIANYPVSAEHGLLAEFAIKNGVMSFTETIDFDIAQDNVRPRIYEAQAKCFTLKTALDLFGSDTQRHIVINGGNAPHAAQSVDLLSTVGKLYSIENAQDMVTYYEAMEQSAGIRPIALVP